MKEDGGRPTRGDWYLITDSGTLKDNLNADLEVVVLNKYASVTYIGEDDGDLQDGANWYVNQG